MLLLDCRTASTAARGRHWRSRRRFFVIAALLLLAACVPGGAAPATSPAAEPQLYVMARTAAGWDLAAADMVTGQLTPLLANINGFAPGARHFGVVLDGGRRLALWDGQRTRTLRDCVAQCREPALAPGEDSIAWLEEGAVEREGWVMSLPGGSARSLGLLEGRLVWSPRGDQLAFAALSGLMVWDVAAQRAASIELPILAQPSWAPDGARLAVIVTPGAPLIYDVGLGLPQPLVLEEGLSLATELAWSPTGDQMALLRRRFFPPEGEHSHEDDGPHEESSGADALGAQPWVLTLATGAFMALPGDSGAGFARPVWSADGRWLAAVRLPMGAPDPQPEVWVWDAATGQLLQRFPGAAAPAWGFAIK